MPSARFLIRLQQLTWVLIFGGLFAIVFGLILRPLAHAASTPLLLGGAVACVVGAVLIYWRSRLAETRP